MKNLDKIKLKIGTAIKVRGFPFVLPEQIEVLGKSENKDLIDNHFKSIGVPSVLKDAQSDACETMNPSSESMNDLK